jgi:hypothetical protein
MQIKQTLVRLFVIIFPSFVTAQTTYLPQNAEENILIDRLEIKAQKDSALNFSKTKPYSRKTLMQKLTDGTLTNIIDQSKVDGYNYNRFFFNSLEWIKNGVSSYQSKKKILKYFYETPGTMYDVHNQDFDLAINPVFYYQLSKENNNSQKLFLNTRGVRVRGRIAGKIGFDTYLSDNQERDPLYVQQSVNNHQAVPGDGYYKSFKTTGYDFFDARGTFSFSATKFLEATFGYDKNFIGNGYRSLFLSDISNNVLFLKLNTRIWRINYQNLFMELTATEPRGPDRLLKKKYAAFHHLDARVSKSVNVGLFEGVIFGRADRFEFGYLNPIIFYRSIEQQNGSFDKSVIGIDAKGNIKHAVQLYGQLLLDEFVLSEVKKNRGSWKNKWGIQAGIKYIDAFGIKNLDLQFESNRVRPFTYSHGDSVSNYTHYNQPLAHPLGANFQEFIGIARYQPAPKWLLLGKLFYWKQGIDSSTESFGSNIFLPSVPPYRTREFGYHIGDGLGVTGFIASILLSYEVRQNLFIDFSALYRRYDVPNRSSLSNNTTIISLALRWNINRREFEF